MSRNYCFTLNNPTEEEQTTLCELVGDGSKVFRYLCMQEEVGESGTHHMQGYVEFRRPLRLREAKAKIGIDRIHLEKRRGSQRQAIDYCKKTETGVASTFVEYGVKASQGKRSDLDRFQEMVIEGASEAEVADEVFGAWARYPNLYSRYKRLRNGSQKSRQPPAVFVFWGQTGTGKSRRVARECEELETVWVSAGTSTCWYEGVTEKTEVLVFDDFYGWETIHNVLRICDRYPHTLRIPGGAVQCPDLKRIYFTSNSDINEWWPNTFERHPEKVRAFRRRVKEIVYFSDENATEVTGNTDAVTSFFSML
jgi:hypothetical protein